MCPLSVTTEPEPALDDVALIGTITRTDAPSARTKLGSRPPLAGGAAGAVGLAAAGCVGGVVGFAAAVGAAPAVGFAGAVVGVAGATVAAGVEDVLTETGRTVGVGVAEVLLLPIARRASVPAPSTAMTSRAMIPPTIRPALLPLVVLPRPAGSVPAPVPGTWP